MTTDTGGPAFPHTVEYKGADCGGVVPHGGMTLRDYFAAKAMEALILEVADWKYMPNEIANFAYAQADAMLKARKK
jgi:hypothetical protein